jgi:hypothetical protein
MRIFDSIKGYAGEGPTLAPIAKKARTIHQFFTANTIAASTGSGAAPSSVQSVQPVIAGAVLVVHPPAVLVTPDSIVELEPESTQDVIIHSDVSISSKSMQYIARYDQKKDGWRISTASQHSIGSKKKREDAIADLVSLDQGTHKSQAAFD